MENPKGNLADEVPVIDLGKKREEVVAAIKEAAETWGAFKVVNHGIPDDVLDAMLDGLRQFHDQPTEAKKILESPRSRHSLIFDFCDDMVMPHQFPPICRNQVEKYSKSIIELKEIISQLLSEGLGLSSDYLRETEYMKREQLRCHYYPACPQLDNTSGLKVHSDLPFLAILLENNVGGFQVLHNGSWIDVPPQQGSLIVNLGDLMQLITNGKYKTAVHRVVGVVDKARISTVCFFMPSSKANQKFSPIKELLSEANPPLYKEVTLNEYLILYKEVDWVDTLKLPAIRA